MERIEWYLILDEEKITPTLLQEGLDEVVLVGGDGATAP